MIQSVRLIKTSSIYAIYSARSKTVAVQHDAFLSLPFAIEKVNSSVIREILK